VIVREGSNVRFGSVKGTIVFKQTFAGQIGSDYEFAHHHATPQSYGAGTPSIGKKVQEMPG